MVHKAGPVKSSTVLGFNGFFFPKLTGYCLKMRGAWLSATLVLDVVSTTPKLAMLPRPHGRA